MVGQSEWREATGLCWKGLTQGQSQAGAAAKLGLAQNGAGGWEMSLSRTRLWLPMVSG